MEINKKIRILCHPSDRTGVGAFRSINPHIALEKYYPNLFSVDIDYEPKIDDDNWLKQYDIIHYHRTIGPYENMVNLNKRLIDLNIVSIMDIDDYWLPTINHPAYQLVKKHKLDTNIVENIRNAEYVSTTTDIFAKEINKLNKNTLVIPNAIDPQEKQYTPKPEPSNGKLRIGYLGGSSHLKDLELLSGLVSKLKSNGLLDKIQFILCGFDLRGTHTDIDFVTKQETQRPIRPMESVWYQYEKIFTDNYSVLSKEYKDFLLKFKNEEYPNLNNEPYRRVWTKPISSYANNYNLFDVSLAPLTENIFNASKSQLKVIEAGFHKKAIIAQNFGPYQIDLKNIFKFGGEIDPNGNAILIDSNKNHKDWFEAIKKLVNNPDLVKTLQTNLNNSVKDTYSIEKTSELRKDLYLSLIKNK